MDVAGGEPVRPWDHFGARRVRAWRRGWVTHWACVYVYVGRLPDGRWFAQRTGLNGGSWAWPDEQAAYGQADEWMRDGEEWQETPAEYNANGEPTTPGWVRRGGNWYRADG